ncbi:hypothetical protein BJ322DRAFT_1016571 [Thelephora terrestris]|uniref:Uncharacterized protein n=1 Tax=Thelephora terrestris TaxID=56493 RepID=A0A9P6HQJ8_9AGAM|nr:hypothetical protein BJ322DRAFT_1016571 [Thelephora terrestris]
MHSLFMLLLFFIAQIAAAEGLVHGRYPRFNHADNPNIQWMMNSVRHTRHGPIYRSVPDPTPNSQVASAFDLNALRDPTFMSKALISIVLLAYFAIALGRKSRSPGLEATKFSTCCESSCANHSEA